jgi:hypothetical protein
MLCVMSCVIYVVLFMLYVILCCIMYYMFMLYVICYVMLLCYVSSMNTVQQSDNGASIRDRSEVCLFVCLFVVASGTVTTS